MRDRDAQESQFRADTPVEAQRRQSKMKARNAAVTKENVQERNAAAAGGAEVAGVGRWHGVKICAKAWRAEG